MKAELELMKGAIEESRLDLDKVRNLLEICSGLENSVYTLAVSRHTTWSVVYVMYPSVKGRSGNHVSWISQN